VFFFVCSCCRYIISSIQLFIFFYNNNSIDTNNAFELYYFCCIINLMFFSLAFSYKYKSLWIFMKSIKFIIIKTKKKKCYKMLGAKDNKQILLLAGFVPLGSSDKRTSKKNLTFFFAKKKEWMNLVFFIPTASYDVQPILCRVRAKKNCRKNGGGRNFFGKIKWKSNKECMNVPKGKIIISFIQQTSTQFITERGTINTHNKWKSSFLFSFRFSYAMCLLVLYQHNTNILILVCLSLKLYILTLCVHRESYNSQAFFSFVFLAWFAGKW
jgi:hypothetical protein